jgi:hypothetical protein
MPRRPLWAEPLTRSERYRAALWASVVVFGLSGILFAAGYILPVQTSDGVPLVLLRVVAAPLLPGAIVAQIVSTFIQSSHVPSIVIVAIPFVILYVVNWAFYYWLFAGLFHSRNQKKQRLRMERIPL